MNLPPVLFQPINALCCVPLLIKIPASLVGAAVNPDDNIIKLSLMSRLVVLTVVVVPFTVKLPVIIASSPTNKLFFIPIPPCVIREPVSPDVEVVLFAKLIEPTVVIETGVVSPNSHVAVLLVFNVPSETVNDVSNVALFFTFNVPAITVLPDVAVTWNLSV